MAVTATACLVGGAASAQAAPAGAAPQKSVAVAEVRTFTGSAMGVSQSQAVSAAVGMAYGVAQSSGWQANQCYVRATSVRAVGGGLYSAVAELFCQR
ncbi:hypothetical protein [Streptomyces clavuligerus]|uniref:Secreted protein n=1 Tax=Streptomyces clavuligerus TaxID=1901 RepID=D5SKN2_STRCL|nr:hypothetical protein [Streptomyces clavuligerus]AXU17286.1 hypothetical protein D1794_32195 [Streptomyces clavuligerus]EFG04475.1 Hypothetical protein SCLAV_p0988 [Streptomyces clavuligerus]MBY6307069.1 hypothetical protein [Streptomyces clavuligerus]QCS10355.1 hypothetical protein CRV15_32900 [Streptomyces clavuligerus]QPJ97600.1 hypothetical protein GE265_31575 [Streptomyces clavuligerus]